MMMLLCLSHDLLRNFRLYMTAIIKNAKFMSRPEIMPVFPHYMQPYPIYFKKAIEVNLFFFKKTLKIFMFLHVSLILSCKLSFPLCQLHYLVACCMYVCMYTRVRKKIKLKNAKKKSHIV